MKMADSIYLDNNATTRPAPEVVATIVDFLDRCWGNASSKHARGEAAKAVVARARTQVAALINAGPVEIVFTSGATEANHQAILGALALTPEKRHIVTSCVEHPSTLALLQHLRRQGVAVTYLEVDSEGRLDPGQLCAAVTPSTALVSLMWANNETGAIFPIAEMAAVAHRSGALFHCDAVQAAGKLPIDLQRLPVDLLSISGHKLHGAQGVGGLYVRKGVKLPPLFFGHQERGRRGGTENLAAIAGFGVAAELALAGLDDMPHLARLRDRLEQGLALCLPQLGINAGAAERLPNTSNLRVGTVEAEIILNRLDHAGIHASGGAACAAGGSEPSHVMIAMGQGRDTALAALRFSLSRYNTAAEIEIVIDLLPAIARPFLAQAARTKPVRAQEKHPEGHDPQDSQQPDVGLRRQ